MDAWLPLENLKVADDGLITADLVLDPGSGWFDGHFPSRPVLPGVVFLAAVEKVSAQAGLPALAEVKKVKFFQIVSPNERLSLSLRSLPSEAGLEARFTFTAGDRPVCQGVAGYRPRGGGPAFGARSDSQSEGRSEELA